MNILGDDAYEKRFYDGGEDGIYYRTWETAS